MRRTIFTAVLGLCLAALSACGTTKTDTAAPASPTVSATPSPAIATVDKKTVCEAVQTLSFGVSAKLLEAMGVAIGAMVDPSKEEAAIKALKEAIAPLPDGLDKEAARTGDPELKAAIAAFGAEARKAKEAMHAAGADLDKVMDAHDEDVLSAAEAKVIALCA